MQAVAKSMGTRLPPYEQEQIAALVEAGIYLSASDFIREAVRERLASLKVVKVKEVDYKTAKQMVLGYYRQNQRAYPSDVAVELELDLELVFEVAAELQREGRLGE